MEGVASYFVSTGLRNRANALNGDVQDRLTPVHIYRVTCETNLCNTIPEVGREGRWVGGRYFIIYISGSDSIVVLSRQLFSSYSHSCSVPIVNRFPSIM